MNIASAVQRTDLYADDPTISLTEPADEANGAKPDPPTRYGQPLPPEWIPLYKRPMRTPTRRLRVVAIGAGIAAMNLAWKIYHEHDLVRRGVVAELCIYEANPEIGGTWLVNQYPGVACDVPAHIYTFPFEPNPNWSAYYASGGEILEYLQATVAKYDLARGVKCSHRVQRAEFSESTGQWQLEVSHAGTTIHDTCDVLVSATGFLSKWRWPSIPGLHDFGGHLSHSAAWDPGYDFTNQRVGIIGNGSSAIQILPQLVGPAAHVTNFIRSPTYITPGLGSGMIGGATQYVYSAAEQARFRADPRALRDYRKEIQAGSNRAFDMFVRGSAAQRDARAATAAQMRDKLGGDEALARKLTPRYEVGCRRATPGPGYLEAFTREDVRLVDAGVARVEAGGVWDGGGEWHALDALVCATGFDVSHRPPWPLIGRGGRSLADAWAAAPRAYLSLCAPGFPNFFLFSGPNAPVGHGSLMAGLLASAEYMTQWLEKVAREDVAWVDVRADAAAEMDAYADEVMQTLVWSGGCQSWYKNHRVDGKVTAVWAGSVLGFLEMVERIRPEDFEIRYRSRNRFRFMGNGRTWREYDPDADLAYYLQK